MNTNDVTCLGKH